MNYSVGVDIGGTKVAIAIVNKYGEIIEQKIMPTDLSILPETMISQINDEIKTIMSVSGIPDTDIIGIGIGAPGPLDSKRGVITCPPNLQTWIDIPIQELVQKHFPYPVRLENDASAATLAEKWIGAAQENDNFVYMTVSTGVGSGIVADGTLLRGLKGNAGDIGHTVVDPSFGQCPCGQYGCLESIASGTAIAKRGSEIMGENLSTKEVFDLYAEGNKKIATLIENVFRVLGVACVTLINTFDTEKIVIGGGVSKVGEPLFKSIQSYVSQYALNPTGRETKIVPAKLEQSAGVVGAAALCFDI
ncbi:ROK family protein [Virgibacillus necropolis]|uniref:Transcriptional regulator n=1 Tax=Virgibacillus necropolis TaxID=163877 RepID=A0A221M941_9BACI|nr:ROK family protein [Virgibacillus necropolis]ASN04168.1 transcriptional regulator [Virgibacillus necropolis]